MLFLNLIHLGLPSARIQRSLTLIAKVIQSLANLNPVRRIAFSSALSLITTRAECTKRGVHAWD
jgi:hypothetical protein